MDASVHISNDEVLQKFQKWIKVAYICGIVVALFSFGASNLNAILLCVAFSKLRHHKVQALSHFARLMMISTLINIVCALSIWGEDIGIRTIIIAIGIIVAGYIGCIAYSTLLKNPQIETQYIKPIRGLYMMMFCNVFILMAYSLIGDNDSIFRFVLIALYLPCFRYYQCFFKAIEATGLKVDTSAQQEFNLKTYLLHPSLVEKGFLFL